MKIKEWLKKYRRKILGCLCIAPMAGFILYGLIRLHIEDPVTLLIYPGGFLVGLGIYLLENGPAWH